MKKLNSMWLQTSSLLKIHVRLTKDEFLKIYELTYEECMELVASGAIQDAKTIIALQYYALHFGGK